MKIAIPVDFDNVNTSVCPSFGRAPFFMIYDSETKNSAFMKNEASTSQGGAGILASQAIVDSGVDALLTPRCGENAAKVLANANVKIYKSKNCSAMDNINAFLQGELSVLDDIHAGFHGNANR